MAENLNYDTLDGTGSWCYNDSSIYCDTYGRLYDWATAMGVSSTYNTSTLGDSVNHRGICPQEWHVPGNSEWQTLVNYAGGEDLAGTYLKSASGWESCEDISNLDTYGFSAPGGGNHNGSIFGHVGIYGYWWSASEYTSTLIYFQFTGYCYKQFYTDLSNKTLGFSLRCLKN